MRQVFENQYCTMAVDGANNLWLNWNANTVNMTGEDFKEVLLKNAELLGENGGSTNIVDVRKFRGPMGPELMEWRTKELFPKYVANGLNKQAFLRPEQAPEMSSDGSKTEGILIKSFLQTEELLKWLG